MTHVNFLGIPVVGDIVNSREAKDQLPRSDFEVLVKALLDDPEVVDFGWTQYTPYFNDGDVCEFGANDLWVRTQADLGGKPAAEAVANVRRLIAGYGSEDTVSAADLREALGELGPEDDGFEPDEYGTWSDRTTLTGNTRIRAKQLATAITSGHFDNVLLTLFGDHANIVVRRTGIVFEFYEHD